VTDGGRSRSDGWEGAAAAGSVGREEEAAAA
jgi:hypothetical protein